MRAIGRYQERALRTGFINHKGLICSLPIGQPARDWVVGVGNVRDVFHARVKAFELAIGHVEEFAPRLVLAPLDKLEQGVMEHENAMLLLAQALDALSDVVVHIVAH